MLLTLFFVPLLVGLYLRVLDRRKQSNAELGPLGVVQTSSGHTLGRRRHAPLLFFLIGLSLLFVGLARPEMEISAPRIEGTVILAIDVSNSMKAEDLEPTRIEAAKAAAHTFVENQPSTIEIGVVAFSNGGLIVQMPTDDQAAILASIDRLSTQGGTSLGHGIFASLNALSGEALVLEEYEGAPEFQIGNFPSAVIVLLTDGENTGNPEPLEIAQIASEAGVRIYPVGIGSRAGTIIEIEGFEILSQLNEEILQEIASLTNGSYYQAEDRESLQEIYKDIDLRLMVEGEKTEITPVIAGSSLLLLLIGGALSLLWFGRLP